MAQSIVGLIGAGTGPRIHVDSGATKLFAVIRGLPDGQAVVVSVLAEGDCVGLVLETNGEHELEPGRCVIFAYDGPGLPICKLRVG